MIRSLPQIQQEIADMPGLTFVELPNGNVGLQLNYNDAPQIFSMEQVRTCHLHPHAPRPAPLRARLRGWITDLTTNLSVFLCAPSPFALSS